MCFCVCVVLGVVVAVCIVVLRPIQCRLSALVPNNSHAWPRELQVWLTRLEVAGSLETRPQHHFFALRVPL